MTTRVLSFNPKIKQYRVDHREERLFSNMFNALQAENLKRLLFFYSKDCLVCIS